MKDYKAVLIDFYGTIADGDRDAVESACAGIVAACEIPLSSSEFAVRWGERFFATIERSNHGDFRTLHECEVISLRETLGDYGYYEDASMFVQRLEDYWRNPPVHEDALAFLSECRIPTVCVSNADTSALFSAIQRHNLRFDVVVTSEMARCYKPDAKIFRDALSAIHLAPEDVFHVGDSLYSDIEGAISAGIDAVWIRREKRIHDIGTVETCLQVSKLTELHGLFSDFH